VKTSDTVALFGLPITNLNMAQAVARIEEYILSGKTHQIATANLDFARNALRDPYLHRIICGCSMVLPDGAPMLWASKMFSAPLQERVTGVDLIPELARLSQEKGYGIYLLGSTEESSLAAAQVLARSYPGAKIVGRYSPPVAPLQKMDHEAMIRKIREAKPRIVLVGFGNPKQEIWIYRHKDRLPASVIIGIGGSLDMIAGKLRRAPRWVRSLHLEWLFRLTLEPKRLMPRYLRDAIALLTHLPLAEGLGGLLEARRLLLEEGLWIWLTGMSNPVRRVLHFSGTSDLFRVATSSGAAIQATQGAHAVLRRELEQQGILLPHASSGIHEANL
jgi:N-acetylglucosaminyldiphosphoundecaprenol N-acetyl-beta-D-mannosaminyltransferase